MIGGGLTGFIIGFLKAKFNANEFLVSMMSTYVITYVMQLLLRTVLQESKHEYLKQTTLIIPHGCQRSSMELLFHLVS